jgi:hypothetical protein
MFLSWWMIGIIGVFWIVSMVSYGSRSFYEGATSVMNGLQDEGYIKIRENDGEIIGLCNQDQDNHFDAR